MEKNNSLYSILWVDDEDQILTLAEQSLEHMDFKFVKAGSPDEALQILKEKSSEIAIVISDIRMPGMTGLEFREKALPLYKDIPFVVVSGFVAREDALRAVELKISRFIDKPIDFNLVEKVILEETADRIASLTEERELLQGFVSDGESLLEEMESILLSIEDGGADSESLNRIFAIAHTIKGSSGFFKPDTIHKFTHHFEDYLTPYKKENREFKGEIISICFKAIDVLRNLLKAMTLGKVGEYQLDDLLKLFSHEIQSQNDTKDSGPTSSSSPKAAEGKVRDEVRIGIDMLDQFMELSGEITVIRNVINKQVRKIEKEFPGNKDVSMLATMLDEMLRINGALQDKVVELRKVPIKNVIRPLQRTIRDLTVSLRKDIQLTVEGENLKVDTSIAEVLGSSLIHMIRNSADHGIESPADREKAGKKKQGTIGITAKQVSDKILVELSDDGKGLKRELLRTKIVEKNLKTREQAMIMSDSELYSMIFESGFSTAAQVTDVSGRGVGMDMVRKSIAKIGGTIEIESGEGKGTKFKFTLPVPKSVTIVASLLLRAGDSIYSLPQDSIMKVIALNSAESTETEEKWAVRKLAGADVLEISNSIFPLIDLTRAFDPEGSVREQAKELGHTSGYIVLVNTNGIEFGIRVDELMDLEDSVVKKLGSHLKDLSHFAGATFLGESQVGLILDVIGLAGLYGISALVDDAKKEEEVTTNRQYHEPMREILLNNIGVPGIWGVELHQVTRLEKCTNQDLQMSGEQPLLIYRGKTMPIYCLGTLLNYRHEPCYQDQDVSEFLILVIQRGNNNVGLAVKNVIDLVKSDDALISLPEQRKGVMGGLVIQDQTVTMIDVKELLEKDQTNMEDQELLVSEKFAA
jgi:two-component system chemotaxis sensor kinase CheA